jgi:hypothetical protein
MIYNNVHSLAGMGIPSPASEIVYYYFPLVWTSVFESTRKDVPDISSGKGGGAN